MDIVDKLKAFSSKLWHSRGVKGQKLPKNWRPHGDSNPGYRRERAVLPFDFIILFVLLVTFCGQVNAIEVELGSRHLTKRGEGDGYQSRFENDMREFGGSVSIAQRFQLPKRYALRIGAFHFDDQSTSAEVTPLDSNYSATSHNGCVGNCLPLATYKTESVVNGLFATLTKDIRVKGYTVVLEGGLTLHRADFTVDVENIWDENNRYFYNLSYESDKKISLGSKLGVGFAYKGKTFMVHKYGLSSSAIRNMDDGGVIVEPPPFLDAYTVSVRVPF